MKELLTDDWVSAFCENLRVLRDAAFKPEDVGKFVDLTLLDENLIHKINEPHPSMAN